VTISVVSGAAFGDVHSGNADAAKSGYFIGFDPAIELLRVDGGQHPAQLMGAKFSQHSAGDTAGKRPPDSFVRVTMLVHGGPWRQALWKEGSSDFVELRLNAPGDFIAWEPGTWHQWWGEGQATMVTINFIRCCRLTTRWSGP
jgi:hypothetical protein